ncbi:CvpA family protein [Agriterribacter sp.]|uniref:CvpA family protein n=1 Tax=Agriterribacter sp. TaxID=2821509 RepID=UPI002CB590A7|nr:CvpA family protein [Agriterribacter sp.]HRO44923.1 CvpA family protein [Agriterribacter sp.]HRQ15661.1 CvpA family protein [Agriterribacter sp.]
MWIDIAFLVMLVAGLIKGAMRGIVMALFSFAGWIIGLAAALKLSAVVAVYMQEHTSINAKWLPLIAFILVFGIVALLVQWAGKAIENIFNFTLLGWVNRLGGALLYAGMYVLVGSILLFYAEKMQLISVETLLSSRAYSLTAGVAPALLEGLGVMIPAFKNTFQELQTFFDKVGKAFSGNE